MAEEFPYLATSAECAEPINRPAAVKGLKIRQAAAASVIWQ